MLKSIKRTRIYEQILDQIRQLITDGELKQGDLLPPERELARRFKVGRSSLREAISALEFQGLVQSHPGSGTMITANSLDAVVQTFASVIVKERDYLRDVLEMRALLEPQVASLAASRASSEDIHQMQDILDSAISSIPGEAKNVQADNDFHLCIFRATQNSALIRLAVATGHIIAESQRQYLQSPERFRRSVVAHQRILDACKTRDSKAAEYAMYEHILDMKHEIEALAKKDEEGRTSN